MMSRLIMARRALGRAMPRSELSDTTTVLSAEMRLLFSNPNQGTTEWWAPRHVRMRCDGTVHQPKCSTTVHTLEHWPFQFGLRIAGFRAEWAMH